MESQKPSFKKSTSMLLVLPVELRLCIAEYALEQRPEVGIPPLSLQLDECKNEYQPSENLSLLLVCRQFNLEFMGLAYNKTRFTLWTENAIARMLELPLCKLRNIRRLVARSHQLYLLLSGTGLWENRFHNQEQLHLDELILIWPWYEGTRNTETLVSFLRQLRHVKVLKSIMYEKRRGLNRMAYLSLVGAILKEDHFQRYDAPSAPKIEATWWTWRLNPQENIITFKPQEPRPVFLEEDYVLLMKPMIDVLMAEAEQVAGL